MTSRKMVTTGTLLVALVIFTLRAASADGPLNPPFSRLSPSTVAALKGTASTPVAQRIIAAANDDLTQTPDPLPRIHTEGTLPHHDIYDESAKAEQDFGKMRDLALAYRITGERKYLDADSRYLSAWVDTYRVSFNPIDETKFDAVFLAYDLIRADLPNDVQRKWGGFFETMAIGYLDFIHNEKTEDTANWQSHRIKLITLCAFADGNQNLIGQARTVFQRHIKVNLRPDGSVEDFYKRDALHYVTYDLEPLTATALAAKAHGEDWFNYKPDGGASLKMAVDWLVPYANGDKPHEEFVHSTVPFDAQRAAAGINGYSGPWHTNNASLLYGQAASLDATYKPLWDKLAPDAAWLDWIKVLNAAGY